MTVEENLLNGVLVMKPRVFDDPRGYFFESYSQPAFEKAGVAVDFVQDNQSLSSRGVLRGLHLQNPPHEQGKLVRVITGEVLDVVVDIRKGSPTYGQHISRKLSAENHLAMWIPPGFAHGFVTLQDNTIFCYKCTGLYNKPAETGIRWDDPELGIDWGIEDPIVSDKDQELPAFADFESLF